MLANKRSKFDLGASPVLLLCRGTLGACCVPFCVGFRVSGLVGPWSGCVKRSGRGQSGGGSLEHPV